MSEYRTIFTRESGAKVEIRAPFQRFAPVRSLQLFIDGKPVTGKGCDRVTRLPKPINHPSGKIIVAAIGPVKGPSAGLTEEEADAIKAACAAIQTEFEATDPTYLAQKAEADARRAAAEAEDAMLLAAMQERADELVKQIPLTGRQVEVRSHRDVDGYDIHDYYLDGVKLPREEVIVIGTAYATRPGAWNHFDHIVIAYILRPDAEIVIEQAEDEAEEVEADRLARIAAQHAKVKEAAQTGKPVVLREWSELINGDDGFEEIITTRYVLPDGNTTTETTRRVVG